MGQGKKSKAKPLDDEQSKQLSDAHNQVYNLAPPVNGCDKNLAAWSGFICGREFNAKS